jgi:hypothetical protein
VSVSALIKVGFPRAQNIENVGYTFVPNANIAKIMKIKIIRGFASV